MQGCDLWEEVRSDDFYFNRMAYVYSLNEVAKFADLIGEDGQIYRDKADEIKPTAEAHYTGSYIYESLNRKQDGAGAQFNGIKSTLRSFWGHFRLPLFGLIL